jgi:hypothetical protein
MAKLSRCPSCDAHMILISVDPINSAVGMHHLSCSRCDYSQHIATLEIAKSADGWKIEQRRQT